MARTYPDMASGFILGKRHSPAHRPAPGRAGATRLRGRPRPRRERMVPGDRSVMNEITGILSAIEQGDPYAAGQLLPLVYDELRKLAAQRLAREKPGQT